MTAYIKRLNRGYFPGKIKLLLEGRSRIPKIKTSKDICKYERNLNKCRLHGMLKKRYVPSPFTHAPQNPVPTLIPGM